MKALALKMAVGLGALIAGASALGILSILGFALYGVFSPAA
jgi:hypothetical protein